MHLFLSSSSALNSTYSTESGKILYKVDSPSTPLTETRRTLIRRAVETVDGVWLGDEAKNTCDIALNNALISLAQSRSPSPESSASSQSINGRYQGHFAHLAQIEYKALNYSCILHAGQKVRTDKLFKSQGWSWYGLGRHKVFQASDGCNYRWVISSRNPKLVSNDSSKTLVARFHRSSKPGAASLEIFPEGEHIMDEILITFVYLRDAEED